MGSEDGRSPIAGNETKPGEATGEGPGLQMNNGPDEASSGSPKISRTPLTQSRRSSGGAIGILSTVSEREDKPPLPPRPSNLDFLTQISTPGSSLRVPKRSVRPQLQSQATTGVSRTDIQTQSFPDGSRETYAHSTKSTPSGKSFRFDSPIGQLTGINISEGDDSTSLRSYLPVAGGDVESLLGDVIVNGQQSPAWRLLSSQVERDNPFDLLPCNNEEPTADFSREFDELGELHPAGDNEGILILPFQRFWLMSN